jgi:hypothetical protein
VAVIAAYVFFATRGTMRFAPAPAEPEGWDDPGQGYYAQLAEGFLRGHTYLAFAPDPRMATLADPYDYGQRDAAKITYLWDASYARGHYYLYFTPLPVVLFYVPFRLLTGQQAPDAAAAVFFSIWILIAAIVCLRRARIDRPWWIVFVGLANLLPFALSNVRVYEVAILSAAAFSTSWAAALLRFVETPSRRAAVWMSLWLALAIVARPNLIVLIVPTAFLMLRLPWRLTVAAAVPLLLAAGGFMTYNAVRFGNPLETGVSGQLTYVSMRGVRPCSLCSVPEALRFANNALQYAFTPPRLGGAFPYANAGIAHIDKRVSWPGGDPEEIIGMAPLVPLTLAGLGCAALLLASRRRREPRVRAATSILGGASLILLALSTCWWIVSRYTFDFQILMLLGTLLCFEEALGLFEEWSVPVRAFRVIAVLLALYSIALSILLGFEGRGGAFR